MILIVDDRPENILSLKSILQLHSFPIDSATSGEEALKKALKNSYALIILDVQMPGMDGFEVAQFLSDNNSTRDIPIIFLSAVNTEKKFITKGYSSGAIDYIVKPIDPDILLLKVKTFYRLYEQNRELNEAKKQLQEEVEIRKAAQKQIHEKASELQGILSSIPQIAFTAKPGGEIDFVNEHWYSYSNVISEFPSIHPDDPCIKAEWKKAVETGNTLELELRIAKFDEGHKYHLLRAMPIKENGSVVKWVGTFTDIEDQKQAIKRREDFLGVVSHELKTPLTSINGYMEIIDSMLEDGEMKFFSGRILKQLDRLQRLINELLDISKMKNGKLDFVMEEIDTEKLISGTIELLRDIYPKNNIVYTNSCSHCIIKGNALRLEQVITNLISNAVKYSVKNNKIEIETKITADNKFYCSVRDWGIGIPQEKQQQVFNKFYRVADSMTYVQGLGIGLYICAEILQQHNAEFNVSSQPGEGSLFYFTLPVLKTK